MAIATVSLAWNCIASILMPNLQPGQITVVLGRKAQLCGLYQGASSDVPQQDFNKERWLQPLPQRLKAEIISQRSGAREDMP